MKSSHQKIGLIPATSLVVGNMIGAGVFVLPAALSKYGSIGLIGWVISAFGAIILAIILVHLGFIFLGKFLKSKFTEKQLNLTKSFFEYSLIIWILYYFIY